MIRLMDIQVVMRLRGNSVIDFILTVNWLYFFMIENMLILNYNKW